MGPWTAVGIEHDGSATHMTFGKNLPPRRGVGL